MAAKLYTRAFDIGARCAQGRRPNNEDKVLGVEQWPEADRATRRVLGRLYIVADGVGGNDDGEVASTLVVQGLMRHYYEGRYACETGRAERLRQAIAATSRDIFAEAAGRSSSMRSTVVAALILDPEGLRERRRLIVANVGDSPALLFRKDGPPRKLTQDHLEGDHVLSQAMGDEHVDVALSSVELRPDDIVVLCSDGLSDGVQGPLSQSTIGRVVRSSDAQAASEALVRLAFQAGSSDNISAIVIRNGARPFPVRRTAQLLGIAVVLALLLGSAFAVGFVPSGHTPFAPRAEMGDAFNASRVSPTRDVQHATSTLAPTTTPTAPPTITPRQQIVPAKPTKAAPPQPPTLVPPIVADITSTAEPVATVQIEETATSEQTGEVEPAPPAPETIRKATGTIVFERATTTK